MKQQIWVIHGGDSFATYDEYLEFLKTHPIDFARMRLGLPGWKGNLRNSLGEGYEVISPTMPNRTNAKYNEWKIWFERLIPFMNDEVILVGHSLGGCFLPKYLGEEDFPRKVKATFLLAAPYDKDGKQALVQFVPPERLALFEKQGGNIFLYHSKDDPVVDFTELAKYQKALPNATVRLFEDRQHFNQEEFPEIVADIRACI